MNTAELKKAILVLYKDSLYQELNAYYNETTLFKITRLERK